MKKHLPIFISFILLVGISATQAAMLMPRPSFTIQPIETKVSYDYAYTIYRMTYTGNPTETDLIKVLNRTMITKIVELNGEVYDIKIQIKVRVPKIKKVPVYANKTIYIPKNDTFVNITNCSERGWNEWNRTHCQTTIEVIDHYNNVTSYEDEWRDFVIQDFRKARKIGKVKVESNLTRKKDLIMNKRNELHNRLTKRKYLDLRVIGKIKPQATENGWGVSIDHIPFVDGKEYPQFTWWNTTWSYRKVINISNSAGDLTDFTVRIDLDTQTLISAGKMNSDCSDIRVANDTREFYHYTANETCNTTTTRIFAKIDSIANNTNTTIYIYYGNIDATDNSNGENTFLEFDEFDDGSFNTSKWSVLSSGQTEINGVLELYNSGTWSGILGTKAFSSSTVFGSRTKLISNKMSFGARELSGWNNYVRYVHNPTWTTETRSAASQSTNNSITDDTSNWHIYEIRWNYNTQVEFLRDFSVESLFTTNVPATTLYLLLHTQGAGDKAQYDYVYARKYANPEPTIYYGNEETQGGGSNSAPSITINSPVDNFNTTDSTPDFTFTATDDSDSTFKCELFIDGVGHGVNNTVANNTQTTITANSTLSDGSHSWYIKCTDSSSASTSSTARTITVDTTAPSISWSANSTASGTYSQNYIYYCAVVADLTLDVVGHYFNTQNYTVWDANYCKNQTGLSDGTYSIYLWANDTVGHYSQTTTRTITLDTTAPTLSITFPVNNSYYALTWINITGTASDSNPDTVYINDSNFGSNIGTYSNWNFTRNPISDGFYSLLITANDTAGNSRSASVSFTIDTTTPSASWNSETTTEGYVTHNYILINCSLSDANADTKGYFNGTSNVTTWTGNDGTNYWTNLTGLSDGTYSNIYCWINDTIGHYNETGKKTWTIDTVNPSISFVSPTPANNTYTTSTSFTINVSSNEQLGSCSLEISPSKNTKVQENKITYGLNETFYISYDLDSGTAAADTEHLDVGGGYDALGNWSNKVIFSINNSYWNNNVTNAILVIRLGSPDVPDLPTNPTNITFYYNTSLNDIYYSNCKNTYGGNESQCWEKLNNSGIAFYSVNISNSTHYRQWLSINITDILNSDRTDGRTLIWVQEEERDFRNTAYNIFYIEDDDGFTYNRAYVNFTYVVENITMTLTADNMSASYDFVSPYDTKHDYSVYCSDKASLLSKTGTRTITVDTTYPLASWNPSTTTEGIITQNYIFLNCSLSDVNADTRGYYNGTTNVTSWDGNDGTNYWKNMTGLSDGTYSNIYCWINDSVSYYNETAKKTWNIDTTVPIITVNSQTNTTTITDYYLANITVTETNKDTCLIEWESVNYTMSYSTYYTYNFTNLQDGNKTFRFYCNDTAGHMTLNEQYYIDIEALPQIQNLAGNTTYNGSSLLINGTLIDNTNVSCYLVEENTTGTFTNSSWICGINKQSYVFMHNTTLNNTVGSDNVFNIYVNDTSNNLNVAPLTIRTTENTTTTTTILITIHSPKNNKAYATTAIKLEVSANGTITEWRYDIGSGNVTFTPNTTIAGLSNKKYHLIVWGLDESGTWYKSETDFIISVSSGGGGGSSIGITIKCTPEWVCGEWGECLNSVRVRKCTDINNCHTVENKPKEIEICYEGEIKDINNEKLKRILDFSKEGRVLEASLMAISSLSDMYIIPKEGSMTMEIISRMPLLKILLLKGLLFIIIFSIFGMGIHNMFDSKRRTWKDKIVEIIILIILAVSLLVILALMPTIYLNI